MTPSTKHRDEPSVESEVLEALSEFTDALENGQVRERMNCRQFKLNLRHTAYSPSQVKKTRAMLGISQPLFASFLGVSPKTVKAWEQGRNVPPAIACRFMDEIRRNPKYWMSVLKHVAIDKSMQA